MASSLAARFGAELRTKVAVWLGLAVGICVPYFTLQRVHLFPTRDVPATPIDGLVAFDPAWVWPYASLALLVPLAPLLAERRADLLRYAKGLFRLCFVCFAFFLLMPVEGPRPAEVPDHAVYRAIVGVDRPSNSFPSLHAGLTVYSLLFAAHVFGRKKPLLLAAGLVWGGLIFYATMATRQHWFVDLPAGLIVAVWAYQTAVRRS